MNRRTLWNSTAKTKRSQYTERDKVTETMGRKTGKADIKTTSRQTDRQGQSERQSVKPTGRRQRQFAKQRFRQRHDRLTERQILAKDLVGLTIRQDPLCI